MKKVMVCVTQQKNCDRLIKYGSGLLEDSEENGELLIVHIAHYDFKFLGKSSEGDALEYLYQKALEHDANLTVVRSNNVVQTLIDTAEKNEVTTVVIGETKNYKNSANMVDVVKDKLRSKDIELIVVP